MPLKLVLAVLGRSMTKKARSSDSRNAWDPEAEVSLVVDLLALSACECTYVCSLYPRYPVRQQHSDNRMEVSRA